MDRYYEQSVAAPCSLKKKTMYVLCCIWMVLLLIAAMAFSANLFTDDANGFSVNWLNLLALAVSLTLAAVLFVRRDYLYMDYDYILLGDELTIWAIMNRRRRKRLASVKLNCVLQAGAASTNAFAALQRNSSVRKHKWYAGVCRNYIVYMEDQIRHAALLELDETLSEMIYRQLPAGVWHDDGRKNNNAGISG